MCSLQATIVHLFKIIDLGHCILWVEILTLEGFSGYSFGGNVSLINLHKILTISLYAILTYYVSQYKLFSGTAPWSEF